MINKPVCVSWNRLWRYTTALAISVAFTGCTTKPAEPVVVPQKVDIQTTLSCTAKPIERPAFLAPTLASLLALPDAAARYQALLSDVGLRIEYEQGLQDVLTACGVK